MSKMVLEFTAMEHGKQVSSSQRGTPRKTGRWLNRACSPIESGGVNDKSNHIRFHFETGRLLFLISPVAQGNKRLSVPQALLHDWIRPLSHTFRAKRIVAAGRALRDWARRTFTRGCRRGAIVELVYVVMDWNLDA